MDPLVSVVTPVYNTAAYLADCIESVLAQEYQNFEYVVLDNCSTDGSFEIAKDFARKDARIRVERNSQVLSQPRNYNRALELISTQSTYCKMVQADDWIYPNCLREMITAAALDPEVAIVSAYQSAGTEKVRGHGLAAGGWNRTVTISPGADTCRRYLLDRQYMFGTPTSVLYRSDIVRARNPFFGENSYHEDSEVCFEILRTHKFAFVHQVLSETRVDNDSLSSRVQGHEPDTLHEFIILHKYGRWYLTGEELESRIKDVTTRTYSILSYRFLRGKDPDFWRYYERGFAMAGQSLSYRHIWVLQMQKAVGWIGNPLATFQKVWSRVRHHWN